MAAMAFRKGDKVVRVAGVDDGIGTVVAIHEQRVDLLAPLGAIRSYESRGSANQGGCWRSTKPRFGLRRTKS